MTCIGFVYLWRDRKHKRYYLGSHKGRIDDGYIGSSKLLMRAFKKRPTDFTRRIIKYCLTETELRFEEQRFLDMIKDAELFYKTKKYYNISRSAMGGDRVTTHPNREQIIKSRYGKKHSDGIKRAIANKSEAKKKLHRDRRLKSLRKTLDSPNYTNYQDRPFEIYHNSLLYKQYRNKLQLRHEWNVDGSVIAQLFKVGYWIPKQKRKTQTHPFNVGDKITFSFLSSSCYAA